MPHDHQAAADQLADLLARVSDDQLAAPTPCPAYTLGDLAEHVGGFAIAFTAAARKETLPSSDANPSGDASRLEPAWRDRVARDLSGLAEAWRDPAAWDGMTSVGGVDLPGAAAGLFAMDELVVHGWDVARASGQAYDADPPSVAAIYAMVEEASQPGQEQQREGLFGPVVSVPRSAPQLDRLLGLTGRDPGWAR